MFALEAIASTSIGNYYSTSGTTARALCVWPMKCRAETDYPRVSRFPVPQDKGNVGSGDEIAKIRFRIQAESRQRENDV